MTFSPFSRLADLTIDEFRELLRQELSAAKIPASDAGCSSAEPKRLLYGIRGIEQFFHVSHRTAQEYKNTFLKPAVSQNGRKIVVDADLAMKLFDERRASHV